jgi:hypothetical protein
MKFMRAIFIIFSCYFLVACGSKSSSAESTYDNDPNSDSYSLNYADIMEFTRGVLNSYEIEGQFSGQTAETRITIDGLPDGASFTDGILSWEPSCQLKPESGWFIRGYFIQRLRINFASVLSDDVVQKPAILVIHKDGPGSSCESQL